MIVIARGGGSLEDLMAFNSEVVCRAVASATTPVVSAVGHERDVTLCDDVADLRVSTPSAAAAAVLPSLEALEVRLGDHGAALRRGLGRERARAAEALGRRSADLARALRGRGDLARDRVERLAPRLGPALGRVSARAASGLDGAGAGLRRAATARAQVAAGRVERAEALLALLSPRRTVARGYAIVRDGGRRAGGRVRRRRPPGGRACPSRCATGVLDARAGDVSGTGPAEPPPTFEEALRRLDEVVARLEGGEVGLEEAVALFEQGQGYLAACRERLAAAQKRIEELTADELGPGPAGGAAKEPDPPF